MQDPFARLIEMKTSEHIIQICDSIKELLIAKNAKYGDSALNPTRIFSSASSIEQLFVRIDDKLSRISKGVGLIANDEDVLMDLIGYLVLLKIALERDKTSHSPWDGTDIDKFPIDFREYNKNQSQKVGDSPLLELQCSGDRFS